MKKILAVLLCLTILFALTLCISAAVSPMVECTLSDSELAVGDTVTVVVYLKNCPRVKTLGITPQYDDSVFELVSGEWLLSNSLITDFNKTTRDGVAAFANDTDCNGNIFSFKLKVKSFPIFDDVTVSATAILQNSDYNGNISNTSVKSSVKIVNPTPQTEPPSTTPVTPTTTPVTPVTTPAHSEDTVETTPDTTVSIDTLESSEATEDVQPTETTGTPEDTKAADETNDVIDGHTVPGKNSNKLVWIIVMSIIAVMAIGTFLYMRYKNR